MSYDPSPQPLRRMLTAIDCADVVQVGRGTIYRWVRQGLFPQPKKITRNSIRWTCDSVEEWQQEQGQEQEATPATGS